MGNADAKLLLIGLDNSGKTTILSRLADPNVMQLNITPTIGFRKEQISKEGIDFQIYDMSGQAKYRDLWQSTASGSIENLIHGIIFVVDSSNKMRLKVARSELDLIIENKSIPENIPYLFFANKCDIKGGCSFQQVQEAMGLKSISRTYQLVMCSGLSGKGVQEGFGWLAHAIRIMFDAKV